MRTRIISAIIAALIFIAGVFFGGDNGILAICGLVGLGCVYEYTRLAFKGELIPNALRVFYFVLSSAIYASVIWAEDYALGTFVLGCMLFFAFTLLTVNTKEDLQGVLRVQSTGIVGFLYCGMFPALAAKTVFLYAGHVWFLGLLAVVFSGDTFAYFSGRVLGRHKLLEAVSPKKTTEGAIGGLLGSMLAGLALGHFFVPHMPIATVVVIAMVTGVFAQIGDLFESLLKRVADVKDSGSIMPGHGGLLDRVDGVYFAAPIYYFLINVLQS